MRSGDQALAASVGADRGRQHTGNCSDRAVEAELTQNGEAVQHIVRNCADGCHEAERDRQVVVASLFRNIGGSEIDGDASGRKRETGGDQRSTHTLPGFRDSLVGQADNIPRMS